MKKEHPHHSVRQRQKMSRRMIVYISAFCLAFITTGLVIVINLTHIEKSVAQTAASYTIEDESFVTDKSLPATIVKQHPLFGPQTKFMRKAKAIPQSQTNISE